MGHRTRRVVLYTIRQIVLLVKRRASRACNKGVRGESYRIARNRLGSRMLLAPKQDPTALTRRQPSV